MVLFPFTAFRLSETLPIVNLKSWVDFQFSFVRISRNDDHGCGRRRYHSQEQVVSIYPGFAMLTAAKVALMPAIAVSARSTNS